MLEGVLVPLITPFIAQNQVNIDVFVKLLSRLADNGVDGVVIAGSTGEGLALTPVERDLMISKAIETVGANCSVIVGCSAYRTSEVIENINRANALGADAAMITHPYYSLPDQRELLNHYATVDRNVDLDLIVYNNPSTTGIDASPDLLSEMVGFKNIKAIKESSGDASRVSRIQQLTANKLAVLCGTDNMALEQLAAGARGWIAGVANVIPSQCVDLYRKILSGDLTGARHLYSQIYPYLHLAESTGKYVQVNRQGLTYLGIDVGSPRLPLLDVTADLASDIESILGQILQRQ